MFCTIVAASTLGLSISIPTWQHEFKRIEEAASIRCTVKSESISINLPEGSHSSVTCDGIVTLRRDGAWRYDATNGSVQIFDGKQYWARTKEFGWYEDPLLPVTRRSKFWTNWPDTQLMGIADLFWKRSKRWTTLKEFTLANDSVTSNSESLLVLLADVDERPNFFKDPSLAYGPCLRVTRKSGRILSGWTVESRGYDGSFGEVNYQKIELNPRIETHAFEPRNP